MKTSKRAISLFLSILILITSLFVGAVSVSAATSYVYTTDAVRLRSSASITSDNVITTLNSKEKLTLLQNSSNGWAYVSRQDGTKGYCSVDYLNPDPNGTSVLKGVTNDEVNFRKGATTDSGIYSTLSKGTAVMGIDNSNELWVKVKVGSNTGYLYRQYVDLQVVINQQEEEPQVETPNWFESSALDSMIGADKTEDVPLVPEKLFLSNSEITMEVGKQLTLSAYTDAVNPVQSAVKFTSSNTAVISAYSDGTVKALKEGASVVTATLVGTDLVATCRITVIPGTTASEPTTVPTTEPEDPVVLSTTSLSVAVGNSAQLTANKNVTWKSSNTTVATVNNGIVTGKATGKAIVTATSGSQSATCQVTVTAASTGVSVKYSSVTMTVGKTFYNTASSSNTVNWSSSNQSVAVVSNGFITAKNTGTAVITASNSTGTKTCLVTVKAAEPVRFAYSSPNNAVPNETITLYAVTDKTRTGVKFDVTINGKVTTVEATNKVTDGNTYRWSGTVKTSVVGTHKVVAYSKNSSSGFTTCTDATTSIFVGKSTDRSAETLETRRASDKAVDLISQFEGYSASVYFDTLANNIPTLGYGKVVYPGDSFYNDMTKSEAFAYLVQTVNNGGYTDQLNVYLDKYKIKRNQQQFDGLVSFAYNLGPSIFLNDSEFLEIFTDTNETTAAKDTDAYINDNEVNFRKEASTSSQILGVFYYGDKLTLLKTTPTNNWYYVQDENGTKGYVYADYVTKGVLSTSGEHSLSKIDKDRFTKLVLQYHHAGGCVWGLLYRRVDELDVFYHGEYVRNGGSNKYDYKFTCPSNSSFYL